MRRELHARGSALLPVLIVSLVLALIALATLEIAGLSRASAAKDARQLSQMSCVEAARDAVMGRLRVFGLDPTTIQLDQAVQVYPGGDVRRLRTGHVQAPSVTSIAAVPPNLVGQGAKNRDLSNVIAPPQMGGRHYRVVVACTDPLAGDMELEFVFKYGL